MPLRAFVDSDVKKDFMTLDYIKVLMPLRAFVDSDEGYNKPLLVRNYSLNALTGIY